MSVGRIVLLGAVAGFTIFLGLPVGRLRARGTRLKSFLTAASAGILVFLLWDVLSNASQPVETALDQRVWGVLAARSAVFVGGLALGLLGLAYFDRATTRRRASLGPGAASVVEFGAPATDPAAHARRLAMSIAIGIGLHNFSEGLAIGQSAARGRAALALVLVVGFALHNATEGFGIVAPLATQDERPAWSFLALAGLAGGGPTFLGTIAGSSFQSELVFVGCLTMAAGSILYVVVELLAVLRRLGHRELAAWGLLAGLVAGFATDLVLAAAGS